MAKLIPHQFTISQPSPTVQLSHRGTEQWAIQAVVPGLQRLAESNVRDFYALEKANKRLPKILHPRWSKRIEEMKAMAARMLAPSDGAPAPAQQVFICLLKLLNERWFMEMDLFLARYPAPQEAIEGDSLWDLAHVAVHRIVLLRRHRFADGEVPVCFLECYPRVPPGFAGMFDGVQEFALVSLSGVRFELVQFRHACGLPLEPWEAQMIGPSCTSAEAHRAFVKFAQQAVSLFPDPQRLFEAVLLRTLVEELRHAIDGFRVHARLQRHCSPLEYYQQFGALKLAPEAKTRAMWSDVDGLLYNRDDLAGLGKVTSELSAQMTALAVGPDPRLVLAEWFWEMVRGFEQMPALGYLPHHTGAACFGLCLLSEELGLSVDLSDPDWFKDVEPLAAFSPERVRLAVKHIYAREFLLGHVDEAPFQEIGADGVLVGTEPLLKPHGLP